MKKLSLLILMALLISPGLNAQTATEPTGDGSVDHPYEIATLGNLYWISVNSMSWDNYFIQTADIDASETAEWSSGGWLPIGDEDGSPFHGNYNGMNHTISGLYITSSPAKAYGLFGYADNATFQNLGITDVYINVEGTSGASGALLGSSIMVEFSGGPVSVNNCYSTGVVKGNSHTGGLVGEITSSVLSNSYSTCDVSGDNNVGGLIGVCDANNSITNCFHITGIVSGNSKIGGLSGSIYINDSMSKCYSTGEVNGVDYTGGLVGHSNGMAKILDCYSRCNVSCTSGTLMNFGGLVGQNYYYGIITNCYSTGSVESGMGGLVGSQDWDAITNYSFWDTKTSGASMSDGGTGLSTEFMLTQSTFTDAGWDFTTIWGINPGCNDGYPYLRPVNPALPSVTITCDASGEICSSIDPTFKATPRNTGAGDVSYAWKLNGNSAGQDQNTYYLTDLEPGYVFTVSCEITVTNDVCCSSYTASDEITINVTDSPDAGEITGKDVVQVGESAQLGSTVTGGFWLSADNNIASIDEYGQVTGTGVGETTIGYVVQGGPPCNEVGWTEFTIKVESINTPPNVSDIIPSSTDPIALGVLFSITVSYSDIDDKVETAFIDWGDGSPATNILSQAADETYAHTYGYPGVYTITVSVDDGYGPVTKTYQYVIVYDPSAGFVSGGGWIESPLCGNVDPAYEYMNVSGKANFGFVAKYQKGKQIPEGNTEFQFKAGNLNFKSIDYQWLVIAGSKAQFKGSGAINGSGDFGFMLSAVDADLAENTETDLFRIKIWDKENEDEVVYDNQCGVDDYADLDQTTAIAGGSIVIHSDDKRSKSGCITDLFTPAIDDVSMKVYPNPFIERLNFEFISPEDAAVRIDICDIGGRLVQTAYNGMAEKGVNYNIEFTSDGIVSGIYFYRVIMGNSVFTGKVACKEY